MHGWCVLDTHPICIRNAHLNFSNDAHLDAFHMRIKNASMIPTLTLIQLIQDMRFQCISDAHQKCWNALMQCLKRFKCVSCSLGRQCEVLHYVKKKEIEISFRITDRGGVPCACDPRWNGFIGFDWQFFIMITRLDPIRGSENENLQ